MTEPLHNSETICPERVSVGEVVYPPGGIFGPRIQPTYQLVMVHSGTMTVWIDGEKCHSPAGAVTLLFPGHEERFAFAVESETWHSYLHVDLPHLSNLLQARFSALPRPIPLSSAMTELTHRALLTAKSSLSTAPQILKALAVEMLWLYIGEAESLASGETARRTTNAVVEAAQRYIEGHLGEQIALKNIAEVVAISPSHLNRLFQAEISTSPIAYLWSRRVAVGIELLERTGLPVATIAERCGFQTSYHFSYRVRKAKGLSPLQIRRRAWGQ